MIHIFVGTKAQFIKMMPIMRALERRGIDYNFIDAGQHAALTGEMIRQFGMRPPNERLRAEQTNIASVREAVLWTLKSAWRLAENPRAVFETIFRGRRGICLIHGDTLTTLISLVYAKRCGIDVAHVEAGLRSHNLLDPFPEEIIRLIAMRFSDVLFSPSIRAHDNLRRMGYRAKSIFVGGNTGQDAVQFALDRNRAGATSSGTPYAVMTIHRIETIFSRERMKAVVDLVDRITNEKRVVFVLHEPTRKQLEKFGLFERLMRLDGLETAPLKPYLDFVRLLSGADYVVSDGGSIQEECCYLNKPCLIMREKTERQDGLGENAMLSCFDETRIEWFLKHFTSLQRRIPLNPKSPSDAIVDYLKNNYPL